MVIIGAGGFARELIEIFQQKDEANKVVFYDDVNPAIDKLLFNQFPVLNSETQVKAFFLQNGNEFTIGIGNPGLRYKMYQKFLSLGGRLTSVISLGARIGSFDVSIGEGSNILDGATFSNSSSVGMACIVYYNAIITHDCCMGNFGQLSPGATLLGGARVDDFTVVGSNATVLPKIHVGKHVMVGAASVITKDVTDYSLMVGNPARHVGWVSEYGSKLFFGDDGEATCQMSNTKYRLKNKAVEKIT